MIAYLIVGLTGFVAGLIACLAYDNLTSEKVSLKELANRCDFPPLPERPEKEELLKKKRRYIGRDEVKERPQLPLPEPK